MNDQEILDLIKSFSEIYWKSKTLHSKKKEYWTGYTQKVEQYHECLIHAKGLFPKKIFDSIAPMQTADEAAYLKANYQPETKDVFLEFSNTAKKAITNGNIIFTTSTKDTNELREYLNNDIDNFDNFISWLEAMVDHKLIDAEGMAVVWPERIETDEEGIIIGNVFPQPIIYPVDRIYSQNKGKYVFLHSKKSEILSGNQKVKEGLVFRYVDNIRYIEAAQFGNKNDHSFEITFSFEHGIKTENDQAFTPAIKLMGLVSIEDGGVSYESVFNLAVPHLNLAALHASNDLVILRKVGYPTRVVTRSKCQHQEQGTFCDNGVLHLHNDGETIDKTCGNCRGTGYIGVFGPMTELTINADLDPLNTTGSNITAANAMAYVSPSIDIPKHLEGLVEQKLNRAKEVLHLKSEPRGSGNISATEKNRDKENTESFIRPISDQIWNIAEYLIECIGRLRFPETYNEIKPEIVRPSNFDLVSSEDYVREIKEAREGNMPEVVIQNLVYRLMRSLHHSDSMSMRVFNLIEQSDRLLTLTPDQVALGLSRGTIQNWEAVLHQSIVYLINSLMLGNEAFLMGSMIDQIMEVENAAKELVQEQLDDLPSPALP